MREGPKIQNSKNINNENKIKITILLFLSIIIEVKLSNLLNYIFLEFIKAYNKSTNIKGGKYIINDVIKFNSDKRYH